MNWIKIKKSNIIRVSFLILTIIASLLLLKKHYSAPYVYIGLIWFVITLLLALTSSSRSLMALWLNLAAIVIALTLFEGYLQLKTGQFYIKERFSNNYFSIPNDLLGYAPVKGIKINTSKYYKDELIYDVTYTIDENGLRISPPYNKSNLAGCVLFFIDSFTFGNGLNDNQTLPYLVGIKSRGKYRTYNLAFTGYGPHQMLSALEHKIVENIVRCSGPKFAIYQAIPDHIYRSVGDNWDYHGPKYTLGKNEEAMFAGHFDDGKIIPRFITKSLFSSLIYREITGSDRFIGREKDIDLFVAIVYSSKRRFEQLYPGGKFHVIFWDNMFNKDEKPEKVSEWLRALKSLKAKGVAVHLTSEIIPDYELRGDKYKLSHYDGHPNALVNQILAEYVINNVLKN